MQPEREKREKPLPIVASALYVIVYIWIYHSYETNQSFEFIWVIYLILLIFLVIFPIFSYIQNKFVWHFSFQSKIVLYFMIYFYFLKQSTHPFNIIGFLSEKFSKNDDEKKIKMLFLPRV